MPFRTLRLVGRPRVVYWNNIPTPYVVARFNALHDMDCFDFEVWFTSPSEEGRSWEFDQSGWRFHYEFLPHVDTFGMRVAIPTRLLARKRPSLLVTLYAGPEYVAGIVAAKAGGSSVALWVESTESHEWIRRRAWKEALKRWLFQRVDAIYTTGPDGEAYSRRYAGRITPVVWVPHSTDVGAFAAAAADRLRVEELRSGHRWDGVVFMYAGRLHHDKGLEYLLRAFGHVQAATTVELTLVLVGGGPAEGALRSLSLRLGLRNVHFEAFVSPAELPELVAAADVFVLPSLGDTYALVVDEAMAASVPVIATSAVMEIGMRIQDGENGYIVQPRDEGALAARMMILAEDEGLRRQFGSKSQRIAIGKNAGQWAHDFARASFDVLVERRRR